MGSYRRRLLRCDLPKGDFDTAIDGEAMVELGRLVGILIGVFWGLLIVMISFI
jgi:hypothetical protein